MNKHHPADPITTHLNSQYWHDRTVALSIQLLNVESILQSCGGIAASNNHGDVDLMGASMAQIEHLSATYFKEKKK